MGSMTFFGDPYLEPDTFLVAGARPEGWIIPWARWQMVTKRSWQDQLAAASVVEHLRSELLDEIARLPGTVLSDVMVQVTDSHGDAFIQDVYAVLAETFILNRYNPDPFPDIVVSSWLLAAEYQLGRLRRHLRIRFHLIRNRRKGTR